MKASDVRSSYHPALELPVKLLHVPVVQKGKVVPYHIQLTPTNKCSESCQWCACSARDQNLELSLEQMIAIMNQFIALGCRAVTLTGGGDPLLHPEIGKLIRYLPLRGVSVGLITNGAALKTLSAEEYRALTWIRVSLGDGRPFDRVADLLGGVRFQERGVDWGFSYVMNVYPDWDNLAAAVRFAFLEDLTHVKVMRDMFTSASRNTEVMSMEVIRRELSDRRAGGAAFEEVVFQDISKLASGTDRCWWALARPLVSADGKLYACCNSHFGEPNPLADYPPVSCMGTVADIPRIWSEQKPFDGSRCSTCYYAGHNALLEGMLYRPNHWQFI